ncbi:RHS repeat-associated core domain-containing protein [Brevibacillus borstelensis]|uniref:RHS repeat domain-containing protein n=1 Tax=Brevibacillus borstelensis TaxID=45462 RepID=UPI0030BC246E
MRRNKSIGIGFKLLLSAALLLPGVVQAQGAAQNGLLQSGKANAAPGATKLPSTKEWLAQFAKAAQETAETTLGPAEIPAYKDEEIRGMEWDPFSADSIIRMKSERDRASMKVVAWFYPQVDRLLSHNEKVEKYGWTDREVMAVIAKLPADAYNRLVKEAPVIGEHYSKWKSVQAKQAEPKQMKEKASVAKQAKEAAAGKAPSAGTLNSDLPDAVYDPTGLTYQYKRSVDSPVDEVRRSSTISETDLVLEGKHGMDLKIVRTYSQMDAMKQRIYYSKSGNKTAANNHLDKYHLPLGWTLNIPMVEEMYEDALECDYHDSSEPTYFCGRTSGKFRYIFTLDDGTVLESSSSSGQEWVNYPYKGAEMSYYPVGRDPINGVKSIAWLDYNGYHYSFKREGVYDPSPVDVITKRNVYGDTIVYKIPYDGPTQIIDSVGRYIEITARHMKVYADSSKSKLLKHIEYDWGTGKDPDRVIEHDVNGGGSKVIAEYSYLDSEVFGKAEFNLRPNYSLAARNKEVILDYKGMESYDYLDVDEKERGYVYYELLHQVKYPVEGLTMTYAYSPYDSNVSNFLNRGVVRNYFDKEQLTYATYHPVTSVNINFAKTPHPDRPAAESYSKTIYYPMTSKEIWKTKKDESVRLKNQTKRDGGVAVTRIVQDGLPSQEKTFAVNSDKNFLPRSVETYIGTGADTDRIEGRLNLTADGNTYRYHPVSYVSHMYRGRETKPSYTYEFLGRPASMTKDADVYQYLLAPEAKNLEQVKNRLADYAQVTEYRYNDYGDLAKLVDPKGNTTSWTYLPPATYYLRLLSEMNRTAADNPKHFHKESFAYNSDKLLEGESILDSYPDGAEIKTESIGRFYTYENMRISSIQHMTIGLDNKNLVQNFPAYDRYGLNPTEINMQAETSPGVKTKLTYRFAYDELGRVTQRTYPDQSQAAYEYDFLGRLSREQFANKGETRAITYSYDDDKRKVTMTLPDGTKRFTHFTPGGEVEYEGQIGTNGQIRPLQYNTYSPDGERLLSSAPYAMDNRATTYVYNEDGSLWKKEEPIGTTIYLRANTFADSLKNQYLPMETLKTLGPNGLETIQFYDRHGQLEKEVNEAWASGQKRTTAYGYNAFGQLASKTEQEKDGAKRTWSYRYNPNDKLVYLLDPEKNEYRYGYDPYGNLVQVTENNTQTTKYHYNALSWKISETDVPSGAAETFGYTPNGKVSAFTDKAGNRHEYAYTPFYELSELTTKDKAGTVKNRETKEYYPNTSLVKKETNSNGPNIQSSSPLHRELFYTYDPFLRMNSFTAFGRLYQIRHTDADDQMDQLIYPGNTTVSYSYDDAMRVKEVTIPGSNGSTQTVRYDYQLSDAGDTYTLTYPNGVSLERKRDSFGQVDTLNHFKNGTSVWQEKNNYSFGNVTSIERNGTTYRYEYDKVDRLTKENVPAGENRYSYNGRGSRMTFEGTLPTMPNTASYTFDERNRLRGVTNEKTGAKAEYTYYPDGLRATKTADGGEIRYVYLNGRVIEELDKNGQLKAQNIWGNELLSRKDVAANKRGYYLYNSHGDVVKVVEENGEELNRYEYDTWGNLTAKTEGMSNPFTYSGEIFDGETGFSYLRARYYDPTVGRFISEDTYKGQVDNPLSLNRYAYVSNNPLRYVDPSGHRQLEFSDGGYERINSAGLKFEDAALYWAKKTVEWADATGAVPYDVVHEVVPAEYVEEVKTIVGWVGAAKWGREAGDMHNLGTGAAGAGAAAGAIRNTGKNASKGTANVKRSQHSLERKNQGRPTGTAFNDVQKARDADILIQDDGRWIVRGQNGRIHVFEPNGQHLTTFKNPDNNTKMRIQRGQWTRPSHEQINQFRDIINNLLK